MNLILKSWSSSDTAPPALPRRVSAAEQARRPRLAHRDHAAGKIARRRKPAATPAGARPTCGWPRRIGWRPVLKKTCSEASGGLADRDYFRTLAENAAATIGWLRDPRRRASITPVYYLSAGPPRIQPVGGGRAIIERLAEAASKAGVKLRYESPATRLVMGEARVSGVEVEIRRRVTRRRIDADAVILASGGFQGNADDDASAFRAAARRRLKLISPGTAFRYRRRHPHGDADQGASFPATGTACTSSRSIRAASIPRRSCWSIPTGSWSIRNGRRFFDEGSGLVHETWEVFARDIHFARPGSIAYAILDSRLFDIAGFERAIRSDVPPYQRRDDRRTWRCRSAFPRAI